jgi:predicted amidohydrolase YtcJ
MLPVLAEFEAQGALLSRVSISERVWQPSQVDDAFVQKVLAGRARYHSDWLTTGAIKFIEDGVVESHTAFLPEGYADAPNEKGISFWTAEQQTAAVIRLTKLGFQIYTHAIGDGAIHQTLDAYEAAEAAGAPKDLRNRIEHFEAPYASDIPRLVRLGVIASIQPVMIYPKDQWMGMEGMWQRYSGDDRATRAYPIRSILAAGGRIAFGTDWPVVELNPLLGIRNAVVRQSYDGEPKGGWMPREKITVAEAIKAYTLDSAYAAHRETHEGSITPGKLADFVILSDDLTVMDPDKINTTKVLTTMVGGKVVYQAE